MRGIAFHRWFGAHEWERALQRPLPRNTRRWNPYDRGFKKKNAKQTTEAVRKKKEKKKKRLTSNEELSSHSSPAVVTVQCFERQLLLLFFFFQTQDHCVCSCTHPEACVSRHRNVILNNPVYRLGFPTERRTFEIIACIRSVR